MDRTLFCDNKKLQENEELSKLLKEKELAYETLQNEKTNIVERNDDLKMTLDYETKVREEEVWYSQLISKPANSGTTSNRGTIES